MNPKKAEAILTAAKRMFAKYGPGKTRVEEIARMARVAKGTIYNHFGNKAQVYARVLKSEADELIEKISAAVEKESSPHAKLAAFFHAKFKHLGQAPNLLRFGKIPADAQPYPARKVVEGFFEQEVRLIGSILKEGVKNGVFKIRNIPTTANAIGHALKGFEQGRSIKNGLNHSERYLYDLLDLICAGMTAGKRSD